MKEDLKNGVYLTTDKVLVEFANGQWYTLEPVRVEYKRSSKLSETPSLEEVVSEVDQYSMVDGALADSVTRSRSVYQHLKGLAVVD
ncbi:MAG: hypothetical protein ACFB15_03175 [Cyclobacteriaceae bacterium]